MRSLVLIISIIITVCTATFAQELRLAVKNQTLDKVLGQLGVEVSYNGKALSAYTITVSKKFESPQKAIEYLLKDKPFVCERIGSVYVISPKQENRTAEKTISNLPLTKRKNQKSQLPEIKNIQIAEVLITAPLSEMIVEHGNTPEETYLNHRPAGFMPGGRDNTVFTLLRMIPGVRASGEPSEELIVWGSSGGESMISFDGFTLFGMKNFNDNISSINPYMVQDIRLFKGGYDVSRGGRIGAVAEIKGITGRTSKPSLKANLSNLTANIFTSIPLTKRSVFSVAYRQTFYDLYNSELLNPFNGKRPVMSNGKSSTIGKNITEIFIAPRYGFKDLNLKYAGKAFEKDNYSISFYAASDKFDFTITENDTTEFNALQKSDQYAGSAIYNKVWSSAAESKLTFAFSQLSAAEDHLTISTGMMAQPSKSFTIDNYIREISGKIDHSISLNSKHQLQLGAEITHYTDQLDIDRNEFVKPAVYGMDQYSSGKFSLNGGFRLDALSNKIYLQPRLSTAYALSSIWKASASWGLYNQYIARNPYKRETEDAVFVWKGIQDEPLSSMHTVIGITYSNEMLLINAEAYNKEIKNATRVEEKNIYQSDVSVYGADLFSKINLGTTTLFGGYSVSNIQDQQAEWGHEVKLGSILSFSPFTISANYVYGTGFFNSYTLTQQMGMNTRSMSGMGSGGMGGGSMNPGGMGPGGMGGGGMKPGNETIVSSNKPYSRFDVGVTYSLRFKDWTFQSGVSVINLFDTSNVKYSNTINNKNNPITLYTKAMPFTPMFFFEVLF